MMLLIDVGNSNIVFSFSDGKDVLNTFRLNTNINITSDEYYISFRNFVREENINSVYISSVVPSITRILREMFETHYNIGAKIMGVDLKTKIGIIADDPHSVGSDLICDVSGGLEYGDEGLIIDMGTAIKYVYFKNKKLTGVAFAPGVAISMKALLENTALLPSVILKTPKKVLNNSTISCMQSGVIYGTASAIDGMIDRIKEEVNNKDLTVISTGGLAKIIYPLCKNKIICDPNITQKGLLRIANLNIK